MTEAVIDISDMIATPLDEEGDFVHEYTSATCFVRHDPPDEGWGCVFGAGNNERIWLRGFASSFDAWAFVVATTGIDPSASIPDRFKQWTKKPQPDTLAESNEIVQMRMAI